MAGEGGGWRRIVKDGCTWCGHKTHDGKPCRSHIQTTTGKKPVMERCPCARADVT